MFVAIFCNIGLKHCLAKVFTLLKLTFLQVTDKNFVGFCFDFQLRLMPGLHAKTPVYQPKWVLSLWAKWHIYTFNYLVFMETQIQNETFNYTAMELSVTIFNYYDHIPCQKSIFTLKPTCKCNFLN